MSTIDGVGAQYPQPDPRGWLVFHGLPNDLQNGEDATQAADYARRGRIDTKWRTEYDPDSGKTVWFFNRPATPTERALLEHLGHTLPADLLTRVSFRTETLRQRRWPSLETDD